MSVEVPFPCNASLRSEKRAGAVDKRKRPIALPTMNGGLSTACWSEKTCRAGLEAETSRRADFSFRLRGWPKDESGTRADLRFDGGSPAQSRQTNESASRPVTGVEGLSLGIDGIPHQQERVHQFFRPAFRSVGGCASMHRVPPAWLQAHLMA